MNFEKQEKSNNLSITPEIIDTIINWEESEINNRIEKIKKAGIDCKIFDWPYWLTIWASKNDYTAELAKVFEKNENKIVEIPNFYGINQINLIKLIILTGFTIWYKKYHSKPLYIDDIPFKRKNQIEDFLEDFLTKLKKKFVNLNIKYSSNYTKQCDKNYKPIPPKTFNLVIEKW